jgi:DNA end-binding protein Ku
MASGTISFGLVNIPVKVYSATDSGAKISFNQLHAERKTRLKQQMYDPVTGEIVSRDKIVKGFEYAKDQYVVVSEEELEKLELATSRSMDISEFVPLETVDPLYFDSGYYVGPDKGADRAFKLLVQALNDMKHAAVARYVTRGKQNLILLRPLNNGLVMQQLRYSDEVRSQEEVPTPDATVTEPELNLARQFISQLAQPKFDATKYHDEYRDKLRDLLDKKIKGEPVVITPQPEPMAKVVDLMEALKASLSKAGGPAAAAAPAPAPAPAAPEPAAEADERKPPKRSARSDESAPKKKQKSAGR